MFKRRSSACGVAAFVMMAGVLITVGACSSGGAKSGSGGVGGTSTGGAGGSGGELGQAGSDGSGGCTQGAPDGGSDAAGATAVADSVKGFSGTQGQCGWSYGYLAAGAEPFIALTVYSTTQDYPSPIWQESKSHPPWVLVYPDSQHPNGSPAQWTDRRWTSTVAGSVSIRGHVVKNNEVGGDGITAYVRVAGVDLWNATIAYNDTIGKDFDLSADVQVGTTIEFLVDAKANDLYDTTLLTAVISQ